jgi:hypothetical protein
MKDSRGVRGVCDLILDLSGPEAVRSAEQILCILHYNICHNRPTNLIIFFFSKLDTFTVRNETFVNGRLARTLRSFETPPGPRGVRSIRKQGKILRKII